MYSYAERHLKEYSELHPELVSIRTSLRHPNLRVVKYKPKVFYKNLWTPELMRMRGLVVDEDWNPIVRPFDKLFNHGELGAPRFDHGELVHAVRKINGFMGCLTRDHDHGLIISTTGSLDSPFVKLAEKHLLPVAERGLITGVSYLFEIVDPSDPHIIEEEAGPYLIGCRTVCSMINLRECDLDVISRGLGVKRPEWQTLYFGELLDQVRSVQHEGFMVHNFAYECSVKLKSPHYLTKKLFMRIKGEKLTAEWFKQNRNNFDEEYYPLIGAIQEDLSFPHLDQTGRREWIERFLSR